MLIGNDWCIGGGEDGIRTHVPSYPDQLISSQRRYSRFGTSPFAGNEDVRLIHFELNERMNNTNSDFKRLL